MNVALPQTVKYFRKIIKYVRSSLSRLRRAVGSGARQENVESRVGTERTY